MGKRPQPSWFVCAFYPPDLSLKPKDTTFGCENNERWQRCGAVGKAVASDSRGPRF